MLIVGTLACLLQVATLPHLGALTHLNLVVLILVCELSFRRDTEALWTAVVCGLTLDVFTSLPFGSWLSALVISLVITNALAGRLKLGQDIGSLALRLIFIQIFSTAWILGATLLSGGSSGALGATLREFVWQVPVTVLTLTIIYIPVRKIFRFLEYWQPKIQVMRR
jgi:rod shape-determining protein MreD